MTENLTDGVRPSGRFRIYLGSAAGVGKTYAMLNEGRRRLERGADVVIGFVETHGRPHTVEATEGMPIVPRKVIEYRGSSFEEMDLGALLDRHPEVVLVDELAHTNVPGSGPHEKRWQDCLELVDAGIAVITTVNVQHIESLSDAVAEMTSVVIRERVPDWVVRRADQIELIDSSADQLRRRMVHGNIYREDKISAALGGFFKTENLVALRELALRFVADESDEELLRFLRSNGEPSSHEAAADRVRLAGSRGRHEAGSEAIWDTAERIMVAVTGAPGAEAVVRRAARLAARVKGDLVVAHVAASERSESETARVRMSELRDLVIAVGGQWFDLEGDDPAHQVVEFAQRHQVTQILVGASQRSRWEERMRGSVVSKILREAGATGIDVHVIARRGLG
jgi:two-component system, OmpR family, sensor histidine kinase KdpD